jgi:hypothetical protein
VRSISETTLYSRRQNVLNKKFHYIAKALDYLPAGTVVDGERAPEFGGTRRQHNVALISSISLQPAGRLRVPYEDRRLAILTFTRAMRAAAS